MNFVPKFLLRAIVYFNCECPGLLALFSPVQIALVPPMIRNIRIVGTRKCQKLWQEKADFWEATKRRNVGMDPSWDSHIMRCWLELNCGFIYRRVLQKVKNFFLAINDLHQRAYFMLLFLWFGSWGRFIIIIFSYFSYQFKKNFFNVEVVFCRGFIKWATIK